MRKTGDPRHKHNQPINMGVFTKVKLGSTVPVKFSLDSYKVLCR